AADAVVRRGRRKRGGRTRDAAELGEVEDLNAVGPRVVGDDEGVIGVYLDVAPDAVVCARRWGQTSYEQGVRGLGHVDEGGAVGTPDQCVFTARLRIGPTPDVVQRREQLALRIADAADRIDREERQQIHVLAREGAGKAVGAGGVEERGERSRGAGGGVTSDSRGDAAGVGRAGDLCLVCGLPGVDANLLGGNVNAHRAGQERREQQYGWSHAGGDGNTTRYIQRGTHPERTCFRCRSNLCGTSFGSEHQLLD